MLHAQRRSAFLGGFLKVAIYLGLIIASLWFYSTYLSKTVTSLINTVNKVQGTQAAAQSQISGFENTIKDLQSKIPNLFNTTSVETPGVPTAQTPDTTGGNTVDTTITTTQ